MMFLSYVKFIEMLPGCFEDLNSNKPPNDENLYVEACRKLWQTLLDYESEAESSTCILKMKAYISGFPLDALEFCARTFFSIRQRQDSDGLLEAFLLKYSELYSLPKPVQETKVYSLAGLDQIIESHLNASHFSIVLAECMHFNELCNYQFSSQKSHNIFKIDSKHEFFRICPLPEIIILESSDYKTQKEIIKHIRNSSVLLLILVNPFDRKSLSLVKSDLQTLGCTFVKVYLSKFCPRLLFDKDSMDVASQLQKVTSFQWIRNGVFTKVWSLVTEIIDNENSSILDFASFSQKIVLDPSNVVSELPLCCFNRNISLYYNSAAGDRNYLHIQSKRLHTTKTNDHIIDWNIIFSKAMIFIIYRLVLAFSKNSSLELLLSGCPMAGKSMAMATIAAFFRSMPGSRFRIIYVPDTLAWKSSKDQLRFLLDEIKFAFLEDSLAEDIESAFEFISNSNYGFGPLLTALSDWAYNCKIHVIFLIDQVCDIY